MARVFRDTYCGLCRDKQREGEGKEREREKN
jgi:hypothetical protein